MRRLALLAAAAALAAVSLAACGKKGDPFSDPPTYQRTYPKPDKIIPQ